MPPINYNDLQPLNLRSVKYSDNFIACITKPVHLLSTTVG